MDKDSGTIAALMLRFREYRLPRALRMRERVDAGERLSDEDIAWLERVFKDAQDVRPLIERHPEYRELAARMASLYNNIVERGLENEKRAGERGVR
jgi:hypothetical protein